MEAPWVPMDSSDAAEIREREAAEEAAELKRQQEAARRARREHAHSLLDQAVHLGKCESGWLGEDDDGRPIPCTVCRPQVAHVACRTCSASYAACKTKRDSRLGTCCEYCNHAPAGGAR